MLNITGTNGIYDNIIKNNSVRYGRNSISNVYSHMKNLSDSFNTELDKLDLSNLAGCSDDEFSSKISSANAVLDKESQNNVSVSDFTFSYQYMPEKAKDGIIDKMALLGSAYEEMGKKLSVSVNELTSKLQQAWSSAKDSISADSLDLNDDGQIDIAEYSASILVEDMLSSDNSQLCYNNITGVITPDGNDTLLTFALKKNYSEAKQVFKSVYDNYDLGNAQQDFCSDENNLAE